MPPRHRAAASLVVTDPQALLGRLLLQLKLKLEGFSADASGRAQRDCLRAAQEVENAVSQLEAGPPLLRAAMGMVRAAGIFACPCGVANKMHAGSVMLINRQSPQSAFVLPCVLQESKEQVTRLLDQGYIAGLAETLGRQQCEDLPADTSWLVLRPVLRLLLWLVPEHAPEPSKTSAAARPQSDSSAMQGHQKHSTAWTPISEDWRCTLVLAYIRDIATVGDSKCIWCASRLHWSMSYETHTS
jgi:hypothetical protein